MAATTRASTKEYCNTVIAADSVLPGEMASPTVSFAKGIVAEAVETAHAVAKTSVAAMRPDTHRRAAAAASSTFAAVTCATSSVIPRKWGTARAAMAGGGVSVPPTTAWCPVLAGREDGRLSAASR